MAEYLLLPFNQWNQSMAGMVLLIEEEEKSVEKISRQKDVMVIATN